MFPFSPREGTAAARLKRVDSDVAAERVKRLAAAKSRLKADFLSKNVGRIDDVLTEERTSGYVCGYTPNYVRVFIKEPCKTDEIVSVRLGKAVRDGLAGEADTALRKV